MRYLIYFQHEFLQRLSAVLFTVSASPIARMAAGLQFKNQLTSKDPELKYQYQQRWLTIPPETRNYIKKNVRITCSAIECKNLKNILEYSYIVI